jgi:hypothetical protein
VRIDAVNAAMTVTLKDMKNQDLYRVELTPLRLTAAETTRAGGG